MSSLGEKKQELKLKNNSKKQNKNRNLGLGWLGVVLECWVLGRVLDGSVIRWFGVVCWVVCWVVGCCVSSR